MKQSGQSILRAIIPTLALILVGCSTTGEVIALTGSQGGPVPKMELLGRGFGGGPFKVTMPDGEVLSGRYMAPSSGGGVGIGTAFVGGRVITTTSTIAGTSGSFVAQAAGPQTSMVCQGGWGGMSASLMPAVSVVCESNKGDRYQVMF